jgi:hypothetical protein
MPWQPLQPSRVNNQTSYSVYCWRWLYWDAGASATGPCGLSRKQALNTNSVRLQRKATRPG